MPDKSDLKHKSVINQIIDACKTKNAKRGLKALSKSVDLNYLYGGASMLAQICKVHVANDDKPVHIVIDNSIDNDVFDYCRWFALVPLLLKQTERKFKFTVLVDGQFIDTPTQFRRVIDYIILKELNNNVTTQLLVGTLEEFVQKNEKENITFIYNNVLSHRDVSSEGRTNTIRGLIERQIPYVVADVAPVPLLFKSSLISACGVISNSDIIANPNPIRFSKVSSTRYSHHGYAIVFSQLDDQFLYDPNVMEGIAHLEPALLSLFENHDPLLKLPTKTNQGVRLFQDVILSEKQNKLSIPYMGDTYHLSVTSEFAEFPFDLMSDNVNEQIANVCFALTLYAQKLNEIKTRNAA